MASKPIDAASEQRVLRILEGALDTPPDGRARYLDDTCDGDAALRRRVDALLEMEGDPGEASVVGELLDLEGVAQSTELGSLDRIPEHLGGFRLIRKLGAGGMGIVFLAEEEELGRQVALKLIRPEQLYFSGSRERFRREVEAVARLQHPSVVPVFTVGEDGGLPYFSMEYVEGCSLADVLRGQSIPPSELSGADLAGILEQASGTGKSESDTTTRRPIFEKPWAEVCLAIATDIAEALAHAHERGVLHRDVKPSNVLITRDGRARLVDFGLARTEGAQQLTRTTTQLGSLPYMPPEQLDERTRIPSVRQDIYSLGVTLYEMLALHAPFLRDTAKETQDRIVEGEPPSLRHRNRAVSWDLETVCLTAMDPDPTRRYACVGDLLRDLDNVGHNRPIEARRPSTAIRVRRWAQRHPTIVGIGAVGVVLLAIGSGLFAINERSARQKERFDSYASLVISAGAQLQLEKSPADARDLLARCPEEYRGWEWRHLALKADDALRTLPGHDERVYQLAYSPDGSVLASTSKDGTVRLWDPDAGVQLRVLETDGEVGLVAFAADGARLFMASTSGTIRVVDPRTAASLGELRKPSRRPMALTSLVCSPDGSRLFAGYSQGQIVAWDTESGEVLKVWRAHRKIVGALCVSQDGTRLASGSQDGQAHVWDSDSWERLHSLQHTGWVVGVAFARDGERLITAAGDGAFLSDLKTGRRTDLRLRARQVATLDGTMFAISTADLGIRILRLGERIEHWCHLHGHDSGTTDLVFDPRGEQLASAAIDGSIRIWSPRHAASRGLYGPRKAVWAVAFLGSGDRVLAGEGSGELRLIDVESRESRALDPAHGDRITSIEVAARGGAFVSAAADGTMHLWDSETLEVRRSFASEVGPIGCATIDTSGQRVVAGTGQGSLLLWDPARSEPIETRQAHDSYVTRVRFDSTGTTLLSCAEDGSLKLWDANSLELRRSLPRHPAWISDAIFLREGRFVASAAADCIVRFWDAHTGRLVSEMRGHGRCPFALTASPDGTRLVSAGGYDNGIRVWDPDRGRCLLALRSGSSVFSIAFGPAGKRIVSGYISANLVLWNTVERVDLDMAGGTEQRAQFDAATPPPSGKQSSHAK